MRKNIALLAMENEEVEVVAPEVAEAVNDTVVDQVVESPEADMSAMQEIATEMDDIEAAMDEGEETAEVLTQVADKMEESVPEGGIDPIAAEAIRIAVEHLCSRVGMSKAKSGFAMEGFASKTTRVQSTKIAIESISDSAKKIWDALVATIKKIIESVKAFFARLFDAAKKQAYRAESLVKAAEGKLDKKAEGDAKVKAEAILRKDNKLIAGNQLTAALLENEKVITTKVVTSDESFVNDFVSKTDKAMKSLAEGKAEEARIETDALVKIMQATFVKVESGDNIIADSLIGDRQFKVAINGTKLTFSFEDAKDKKEISEKEIAPMGVEEARKVAETVKGQMERVVKYSETFKKFESAQISMIKKFTTTFGAGKGEVGKEINESGTALRNAVNSFVSMINQVPAKARGYEVSVCGAALNYVASSLKAAGASVGSTAVVAK